MKLGDGLQRKRGKNNHTCPMYDDDFLAYLNKMMQHRLYISNQTGRHMW